MGKRRMFSLDIVDTDRFLDMPLSAQALYFHLGMHADDDGFVSSPKRIAKIINSSDDDLRLLCAKSFIIPFDSGVIVIKDWRISNELKNDRYHPTIYQEEFSMLSLENKSYNLSTCIQNVSKMEPELNLTELNKTEPNRTEDRIDYQEIVNLYNDTCISFPKVLALSEARKKAIKARLKTYSLEDFKKLFEMAEGSRFLKGGNDRNWTATFDWLIKDSNMAKVLEGNYEDRQNNKPKQTSTGNIFLDMLQEEEEKAKNEQDRNT